MATALTKLLEKKQPEEVQRVVTALSTLQMAVNLYLNNRFSINELVDAFELSEKIVYDDLLVSKKNEKV